ncbi:MAG: MoaD/ThiS family protein [Promethearchaeota archaeon]|jgi:molybdopterin converting factor small subunit
MSILVKLYGNLRENLKETDLQEGLPASYDIDPSLVHSVFDILEKLSIEEHELSHIFVNGKYCGVDKEVKNGDRVGLFPKNMSLLFVEILPQNR